MTRYFISGNLWLMLALLLAVGGRVERTEPVMVAFFGLGAWFDPGTYNLLVVLCVLVSVACFVLTWKTRRLAV